MLPFPGWSHYWAHCIQGQQDAAKFNLDLFYILMSYGDFTLPSFI